MRQKLQRLGILCLACFAIVVSLRGATAHEIRPAYLQVDETSPGRYQVLWRTPVLSGVQLPVQLDLPDGARNLTEPTVKVLSDSILERRLVDAGPKGLAGKRIVFDGLQATLTDVFVRVQLLGRPSSTTLVRPAENWVDIGVPESWPSILATYVAMGTMHILSGPDHLLFILGLMALAGSRWMLVKTITAFTVAHSITLALASLGVVHFPSASLEALIALSIFFLGAEMVRRLRGGDSLALRNPWIVAFAFGLLHGFGFAGGLSLAGLTTAEIPLALLSFNIGVEFGQLAFVASVLLLLKLCDTLEMRWPRWASYAPAYLVGGLGAFWTIGRVSIVLAGSP